MAIMIMGKEWTFEFKICTLESNKRSSQSAFLILCRYILLGNTSRSSRYVCTSCCSSSSSSSSTCSSNGGDDAIAISMISKHNYDTMTF